jgi:hypothetical protein
MPVSMLQRVRQDVKRDILVLPSSVKTPLWDFNQIVTSFGISAQRVETITLNGSTVSQVLDLSGNNRTATQTTPINQPTYNLNGFGVYPSFDFDGINDAFTISIPQSMGQEIFAVVDTTNLLSSYRVFLNRINPSAPALYLGGIVNGSPTMFWGGDRAAMPSAIRRVAIYRWVVDTISVIEVDASTSVSLSHSETVLSTWNSIGHTFVQQPNFRLGEMWIIPKSSLTNEIRNKIWGRLHWSWNLQALLPSNHPFKNSPPRL